MDETNTREQVQRHAEAVERGDFETVVADLSDELKPQAGQIAQLLPQPVTAATVVSLEIGAEEAVARIHYAGDSSELTIQSRWRDVGGRPTIVHAEPVD